MNHYKLLQKAKYFYFSYRIVLFLALGLSLWATVKFMSTQPILSIVGVVGVGLLGPRFIDIIRKQLARSEVRTAYRIYFEATKKMQTIIKDDLVLTEMIAEICDEYVKNEKEQTQKEISDFSDTRGYRYLFNVQKGRGIILKGTEMKLSNIYYLEIDKSTHLSLGVVKVIVN